jgi:hypothetical protein
VLHLDDLGRDATDVHLPPLDYGVRLTHEGPEAISSAGGVCNPVVVETLPPRRGVA